jgi:hypothetical protein
MKEHSIVPKARCLFWNLWFIKRHAEGEATNVQKNIQAMLQPGLRTMAAKHGVPGTAAFSSPADVRRD